MRARSKHLQVRYRFLYGKRTLKTRRSYAYKTFRTRYQCCRCASANDSVWQKVAYEELIRCDGHFTCFEILIRIFSNDFLLLYYRFESRQFASIFVGVMPLKGLRPLVIHHFLHFSLTYVDKLSWNFAYEFVELVYRSSLSAVNLRLFCRSNAPFWT